MADRVSRRGKRKTTQFGGMFVWIIVFYFYNIFLPICIGVHCRSMCNKIACLGYGSIDTVDKQK